MKRKDALWVMQMCRDRDARSEAEREAFDTAIEALKSESIFTADRPTDGDLISRRAVINEIERWFGYIDGDMIARISIGISKLPSADRPRGEWIEETSWKYKKGGRNSDMKEILGTEWMTMIRQRCSECNKVTMVDGSILYKYCPHCGSKMRGDTE